MFETELILNNRTLCEIYDDSNVNPDARSIPCRYKLLNKIFNHFWKRRTKEYLATIRDLQKIKATKGAIDIKVFGY